MSVRVTNVKRMQFSGEIMSLLQSGLRITQRGRHQVINVAKDDLTEDGILTVSSSPWDLDLLNADG